MLRRWFYTAHITIRNERVLRLLGFEKARPGGTTLVGLSPHNWMGVIYRRLFVYHQREATAEAAQRHAANIASRAGTLIEKLASARRPR